MFIFDEGEVEWKPLGQIVDFKRGKRVIKSQLEKNGKYTVYQNSIKPLGYYYESNVEAETTFIISAGSAGTIGFSREAFWAADDILFAEKSKIVNQKSLFHFFFQDK